MEGDNFVGIVEVLSYMQFIIIIFFYPHCFELRDELRLGIRYRFRQNR